MVDFGLSRFFENDKLMQTVCGTHQYLAPELVQCARGQLLGYSQAIDMWGVGLLAFIILVGFNPFARETQLQTLDAIARVEWHFPGGCSVSDEGKAFVRSLLRNGVDERFTAEHARKARWFDRACVINSAHVLRPADAAGQAAVEDQCSTVVRHHKSVTSWMLAMFSRMRGNEKSARDRWV